jgi:hypothetical protein
VGCIVVSAMDEIKQTEEMAASQAQVVCERIQSGPGGEWS